MDWPQSLDVDYFRLYKKDGFSLIKLNTKRIQLCSVPDPGWGGQNGTEISITNVPEATYEWIGLTNKFSIFPGAIDMYFGNRKFWIVTTPNLVAGYYEITLKVSLAGGTTTQEIKIPVDVVDGTPIQPPTEIKLINDGTNCYTLAVVKAVNSNGYLWSIDGEPFQKAENTQPNQNAVANYNNLLSTSFCAAYNNYTVNVCVKPINICGLISSSLCKIVTIPKMSTGGGCGTCLVALPPKHVSVVQNSDLESYRLSVIKNPATSGYEWSYDQDEWFKVQNTLTSAENQFGNFEFGTPDFEINVRGYSDDGNTAVYKELIHIPIGSQAKIGVKSSSTAIGAGENNETDSFTPTLNSEILQDGTSAFSKVFVLNIMGQKVLEMNISDEFSTELSSQIKDLNGLFIFLWFDNQNHLIKREKRFLNSNN